MQWHKLSPASLCSQYINSLEASSRGNWLWLKHAFKSSLGINCSCFKENFIFFTMKSLAGFGFLWAISIAGSILDNYLFIFNNVMGMRKKTLQLWILRYFCTCWNFSGYSAASYNWLVELTNVLPLSLLGHWAKHYKSGHHLSYSGLPGQWLN